MREKEFDRNGEVKWTEAWILDVFEPVQVGRGLNGCKGEAKDS